MHILSHVDKRHAKTAQRDEIMSFSDKLKEPAVVKISMKTYYVFIPS